MAIGPIDYGSMLPQLDGNALMALSQQIHQNRAIAQQKQAQAAQQQQLQGDIEELGANLTPENLMRFSLRNPQMAEAAQKGWATYSDERKNQNLKDMTGVAAALQANRPDLAVKMLGDRKSALVSSGETTAETEALEDILTRAQKAQEEGNTEEATKLANQAKGIVGFGLGAALGDKAEPLLRQLGLGGAGEAKVIGYGQALVDPTGSVLFQQKDAPFSLSEGQQRFDPARPSGGGARGSGAPLTVRTNNPGAIKDGPYAKSMPGYVGSDSGFAKFASPAAGAAAHEKLLRDNYLGKGFNTPRKLVERYAPRGPENSSAAVDNYIARITKGLGIGPDDRIPTESLPQLANIMASVESGIGSLKGGDQPAGAVASVPKTKEPPKPSDTRSVGGKVYVKIDGQWFQKGR